MSKLHQDKSSTPLLQKPGKEPETKEEMIKNAFGFDDTGKFFLREISPVRFPLLFLFHIEQ
jgi:hypothetical protein